MIAKLTGILDFADDESIIIDVNGVGYTVTLSKRLLSTLPQVSEKISLWIDCIYRQEGAFLFGFDTLQERQWFRLLMTVQGVGGKMALGILGTLTPQDLTNAIISEDKALLVKGEGVGPKIAARIITELKDKVLKKSGNDLSIKSDKQAPDSVHEAISALANLGYNRSEAFTAVQHSIKQGVSQNHIEDLIRSSLTYLCQ